MDLVVLARETVEVVAPSVEEKGLRFRVELPDAPVPAETNPSKVRRILLNLLGNAVRFTPAGEVALSMDATAERVIFHVRDTGVGIAPENLERIFEPFWQAATGLTREVGGTGLTVARRLALLLGGDVTVESKVGEGAIFTVVLPRTAPKLSRPGA